MAQHYRRKFGIESSIVHRALPGPVEPSPDYDKARHGLRVGMLGSTYSYGPLPILAKAVESAARTLGVPGRVMVIGRSHGERLRAEVGGRVEVEVLGHIEESEAVVRLRDCFALYLNYPFGPLDGSLRRYSFPTKLGTYALAARPILLSMLTIQASPASLAESAGYAGHWASRRESDGAAVLVSMWRDPRASESRHPEGEVVRLRYFDPERNRRALFEPLDALVPPLAGTSDR